jgi:hypothetical protein
MMKLIFNISLLLYTVCSFGQTLESPFGPSPNPPAKPVYFSIEGVGLAQSNELNLDFVHKILFGGQLNNTVNQNIWSNLSTSNQLMGQQSFGVQVRSALDSTSRMGGTFFCIQWQQVKWNHLQFSKDAFGLAMLGNAPLLGKNLHLSGSSFLQFTYQKMGLGIQDRKKGYSIYLNGIAGGEYYGLNIQEGQVFSDPSGEFIDAQYQMSQLKSAQRNSGLGLGLDFYWSKRQRDVKWDVGVNDLGWIHFKGLEQKVWKGDEHFTGLSWSQAILDGGQDEDILTNWSDPLISTNNKTIHLPTMLKASLQVKSFGYRFITYCFERQLGWQTIYFAKENIPVKWGELNYEMAINKTLQNRYALSGQVGMNNRENRWGFSLLASELPGFLMANSRQLMLQLKFEKRIF